MSNKFKDELEMVAVRLRANAFYFLCMVAASMLTFYFIGSEKAYGYLSMIVIAWIILSVVGVDLNKKEPK